MTYMPSPLAAARSGGEKEPVGTILETERLRLRPLTVEDAEFIIALLGDPDFVRNIGDRGVRTVDDAADYIREGPKGLSESFRWRVWLITIRETATPIGTCALLKRAVMDDVEIGYALMPSFRSKGYAQEAVAAVARHGSHTLGLTRLAAVVKPDNVASIHVLEKLGMQHHGMIRLNENEPEVMLLRREL
jgi:[ribosomal protein S5]-alanine N-acetyltransferase